MCVPWEDWGTRARLFPDNITGPILPVIYGARYATLVSIGDNGMHRLIVRDFNTRRRSTQLVDGMELKEDATLIEESVPSTLFACPVRTALRYHMASLDLGLDCWKNFLMDEERIVGIGVVSGVSVGIC